MALWKNLFIFFMVLPVTPRQAGISCCGGNDVVKLEPDFVCIERPDDPTGYLKPICEFIRDNIHVYRIDPNKLEIVEIFLGSDEKIKKHFGPNDPYLTDEYHFVRLNCCHAGDWATMHIETKTCVEFYLSPK